MIYIFGWNSFVLRSFTLHDIGLDANALAEQNLEVRQAYFHIFWIPFFSLGKRWVVRNGDKTYLMPEDIKYQAKQTLTGIRTPVLTYVGLMLVALVTLIYVVYIEVRNYRHDKSEVQEFKEKANKLTAKLQHLTTSDFITLYQQGEHEYTTFLKVEDIQGDDITVTPISLKADEPMHVEEEYNVTHHKIPSLTVSLKQLLNAFPKERDSSRGYAGDRQYVYLFNDSRRIQVKEVVRHFAPIIKVDRTSYYKNRIKVSCYNEGWPATIIEMKNVEGDIDWSEMVNTTFPGGQSSNSSSYSLQGKNVGWGDPFKFIMTVKDTAGHFYKYEIEGEEGRFATIRTL